MSGSDEFLIDHHDEDCPLDGAGVTPVDASASTRDEGPGQQSGGGSSSLSGAGSGATIRESNPAGSAASVSTGDVPRAVLTGGSRAITTVTRNQQIILVGPNGTSPSPPSTQPPWMIAQRTTQTIVAQHPGEGPSSSVDPLASLGDDLASVLWVLEGERRGLGHLSLDGQPRVEQLADAGGIRRDWVVFSVVGGSLDIVPYRGFPNRNRLRPGYMYHARRVLRGGA